MKILVFPYDKNPYQKLLYNAMKRRYEGDIKIKYVWFLPYVGALHIPLELLIRRLLGYRIIHIHWIAFFINFPVPKRKLISFYSTKANIWWMKKLGYKVIWTVHDIIPHQQETMNDLAISKYLSNMVDLKILHSNFAVDQIKNKGLNIGNYTVIPHGNYDGVYKHTVNRNEARKILNIKKDKTVILFFGIVKAYKGIDDLISAYESIRNERTYLVIAGICTDNRILELIDEASAEGDVLFVNEYIKTDDVAVYFESADVVCLPFKSITTSGSVILASTFAKPIVAPRKGALKDLPSNLGFLYSADDNNGLRNALRKAIKPGTDLDTKSNFSRLYADTLNWDGIAEQTYIEYERLNG